LKSKAKIRCFVKTILGGINMVKIGIITGSTRDSRVNIQVAEWVKSIADKRTDAEFELVDIKDYNLPRYNESVPAIMTQDYKTPEAHPWSKKISELDGFVFITPEYNKAVTSGLKDAIDYLYVEWNNKAAGIVSYGSSLGVTAANNLRLILTVPAVATVRTQPALSLFTDFENMTIFKPAPFHEENVQTMLNEVVAWSTGLKTIRKQFQEMS
jgi:NAD(P)H-dependent FMN reductase